MEDGTVSRTALMMAAARAAHLIVDSTPRVFEDTIALRLLGDAADDLIGPHRVGSDGVVFYANLRTIGVARSRYTEIRLAEAVERGVAQYVILGAGLDSFAFRSPLADQLSVLEVDHPATQAWKAERLAVSGIAVPSAVAFVPVDFRVDSLRDRLVDSGFDVGQPAFVSWLGVTNYLSREDVSATFETIGDLTPSTELVVQYWLPPEMRDDLGMAHVDRIMSTAAASGEPWLTFFSPAEMDELLNQCGFVVLEQVDQRDWIDSWLWERADELKPIKAPMLARAIVRDEAH
jgi:methyltransferase (TIGR00027 family)